MLQSIFIFTTFFSVIVLIVDFIGMAASSQGDDDHGGDHDGDDGDHGHDEAGDHGKASEIAHDRKEKRSPILAIIATLRTVLYFCLGFGPVGWYALYSGEAQLSALAWSSGVGVFTAVGARMLRRLQRNELDSQVRDHELLMSQAEVLVSINAGQIGRIRVNFHGQPFDRFAKAADATRTYKVGATVKVVDSDGENLLVE